MTGAQAVHPGYGFLSENNNFAEALEKAGIAFIGPKSYAIDVMGDKIKSKNCALEAKVNCIPGDSRVIKDEEECIEISKIIGYPVMIKASAGGGGKGMRAVTDEIELEKAWESAKQETKAAFGDDSMYIEKFIEEPRHIEIQIVGDSCGKACHLSERD
jgi:acetyl-CoA carboxylase biotin carboxylase subunit